jgi:hypothetical protein
MNFDIEILPYEGIIIKNNNKSISLKLRTKQNKIKELLVANFPNGNYRCMCPDEIEVFHIFDFSGLKIKVLFNLETEEFVYGEFFSSKYLKNYNPEIQVQMYYRDVAFLGKDLNHLIDDFKKFDLTYRYFDNNIFITDAGFFIYIDEQTPEVKFPEGDSYDVACLLRCPVIGTSVYTKEWIESQGNTDLIPFDRTKKSLYD